MQFFSCMFCEEDIQIEETMEAGQHINCPACFLSYEIASVRPLRVQANNDDFDQVWGNPEKQARVRRMERRSKPDFEREDEDGYHHGKFVAAFEGKRSQTRKRIRGYAYVGEDE